ncbi:MAG TPA: glutamate--tRNA ligase, partial [Syntrophales bacterium]|nr:glutamate--tRNA ligase [Syntrophales bacterium]
CCSYREGKGPQMTELKPRVRFAPSPTGDLHVGNARTALFNWLYARRYGGSFVLRIEDTDQQRTSETFERNILEDLRWLSLTWDEGPDKDGGFGPYHQIKRLKIYEGFIKKLADAGCVYPCYCTEEELEMERRELLAMKMMPRYMGKCKSLSEKEREAFEKSGRKPALRFSVEKGPIEFNDLIRGEMKFEGEAIGDFIIVRSNRVPSYNFAAVVDDHLMEITHVIRGEDHLSNTAIQLLLYRALGFKPPVFAHHSLVLGKDRGKLSKRHGAVTVREFRKRGILSEALVNYLSLLGGSAVDGKEVASIGEIIGAFSLERAGRSGAIFDEDKLRWLNAIYIRNSDIERLTDLLIPFIREAGHDIHLMDRGWLVRVVEAVKDNIVTLADFAGYLDIFIDEKCQMTEEARAVLGEAGAVVRALHEVLEHNNIPERDFYRNLIHFVRKRTGLKSKELFLPIRAAVTGRTSGPELPKVFAILGKESVLLRFRRAIEMTG